MLPNLRPHVYRWPPDGKLCPGVLSVLIVLKYAACLLQLTSPLRLPQDKLLWSFNEPFSSILECQVLLTPKRLLINIQGGSLKGGHHSGQDYSPSPVNNPTDCWCDDRMPPRCVYQAGNKSNTLPRLVKMSKQGTNQHFYRWGLWVVWCVCYWCSVRKLILTCKELHSWCVISPPESGRILCWAQQMHCCCVSPWPDAGTSTEKNNRWNTDLMCCTLRRVPRHSQRVYDD